ncbi:MAG: ribonucleotide reductase N-terminal alpha domain-containing protein [archaeon]|nr:ribonucleotide reductase N-terminal alpha domain-containing protein [archaeon]
MKTRITKIRKRDGRIVQFEQEKITNAIYKAMVSVGRGEEGRERAKELTEKVVTVVEKAFAERAEVPSVEDVQDVVEQVLITGGLSEVAKAYILYRQQRADIRGLKKVIGVKDDLKLSVNATEVLKRRYLLKDERGKVIETPGQLFNRVAEAVAKAELKYGKSKEEVKEIERSFYQLMRNLEFLPNSPTLMNAGTELGQLAACFVLPVEDSIEGIFGAVKNMAVIHQSGGGTGFSFSRLRPQGDVVKSTGGIASGPVSFMRVFDVATDVIKQGGKRRGANMGILNVDHPDIVEFIRAKEGGEFANFNTSVAVTDEFMHAVERNEEYGLVNPRTKEEVRRIKAREIFNEIVTYAWKIGDPGIVFIDEINGHNPLSTMGTIEATNPCITADTWIMTADGPQQVEELIGKKFVAIVNGDGWESSKEGFFESGIRPVYRLRTKEGFELRLTADHPVMKVERMTRYRVDTKWSNATDLKLGDKIVLNNHRASNWSVKDRGEYAEGDGYLIGLLLGDGTIKEDKVILSSWGEDKGAEAVRSLAYEYTQYLPHRSDFSGWIAVKGRNEFRLSLGYLKRLSQELGLSPGMKAITKEMEKLSQDFYKGLLKGLFDADGSVQGNQSKGISIRLAQSNLGILKAVQRMLLRLGIFSRIYINRRRKGKKELPDSKGGVKNYLTKPQHELVISNNNMLYFAEKIGFCDSEKMERLENAIRNYKRRMNRERFVATLKDLVLDGVEKVYDVQIPGINAFEANGFVLHNCGEQPLLPYESCNLGSINVSKFVNPGEGEVDWERLKEVVWICVRFLDDVIDVNRYPMPEIEEITKANRKIGLGIMGFAELLIKLGIAYDSKDALLMGEKLMQFVTNEARQCSRELGLEKGPFPNFERSVWSTYRAMRNATVTTIAPTGTISIIAGCSSGIEPLFAVAFIRNVLGGMLEINKLFEEIAKERGFYTKDLMIEMAKRGSIQDIGGIPEDIKRVFVTALDISPEWHVRMQAAFQKYTDNSVSKTVNLLPDATWGDVKNVFLLAYKLKCKGITVYRYGSKEQVLSLDIPKLMLEEYIRADSEYTGECRICSV